MSMESDDGVREVLVQFNVRRGQEEVVQFLVGVTEAYEKAMAVEHTSSTTGPVRKFASAGEFHSFVSRVREGLALPRIRKLFWYSASSCNVAQEIWFEDKQNPASKHDPLKAYAIIHVHYHAHTQHLAAVTTDDLDLVDAVNVRHLAVDSGGPDYSVNCPFFDTFIEASGPHTFKVFPRGDWAYGSCNSSNFSSRMWCRTVKQGLKCSGRQPCAQLSWRDCPGSDSTTAIQVLLEAANSALAWRPGKPKQHRGEDEYAMDLLKQLHAEAMRVKKSVNMHHSSSMKEGLTSASGSLTSQHPKATYIAKEGGEWIEPTWSELPDAEIPLPPLRILLVGADNDQAKISVEKEVREMEKEFKIKHGLDSWGDSVVFQHTVFGSINDLVRDLRLYDPVVLHFACHGEESALKLFGGDLHMQRLTNMIESWTEGGDKRLRLIVANACESWGVAKALAEHVDFVIGHQTPVLDQGAVTFALNLYGALGDGEHLKRSFALAKMVSEPYCMSGRKNAATFRFLLPLADPKLISFNPPPASAPAPIAVDLLEVPSEVARAAYVATPTSLPVCAAARTAAAVSAIPQRPAEVGGSPSGGTAQASAQSQDSDPLDPTPFVLVGAITGKQKEREYEDIKKGWQGYVEEAAEVVTGNWGPSGAELGCSKRVMDLRPSILHIEACTDELSGCLIFDDGAVRYQDLRTVLELIEEDGGRVRLLVLMASNSAGDERAGILTSCADCVVAVDGERTQHSTEFVKCLYEHLRQGRALGQSWRRAGVAVAYSQLNLKLFPSLERVAHLRFQPNPEPMAAMVRKLENASLDESDLSEADTLTAQDTDDDDGGAATGKATVFLYNSSGTVDAVKDHLKQLFGGLRSNGKEPPRLSFCGLLLFLMVSNPEETKFDLGSCPEQWKAWKAAYKEAAASGSGCESELLDKFEEAAMTSGAKSKFKARVLPEPCLKVHTRAIQAIDSLVRESIALSWKLEVSEWNERVVANWFCSDSEATSEEFLNRANRFLTQAIVDVDDTCLSGIHILESLQMQSYGAFLQMNSFTANLFWSLLEVEQHTFHTSKGGDCPAGGFEIAIASDRRVLSLGKRKLPAAQLQSVIVRGLRSMASTGDDLLKILWKSMLVDKFKKDGGAGGSRRGFRVTAAEREVLREYLRSTLARTEAVLDAASGEEHKICEQCVNLKLLPLAAISEQCEAEGEEALGDLLCPITKCLMDDPVVLSVEEEVTQKPNKSTYERAAIERWIQHNKLSPKIKAKLEGCTLTENLKMKQQIADLKRKMRNKEIERRKKVEGEEERRVLARRKGYAHIASASGKEQDVITSDQLSATTLHTTALCIVGAPASGKTTLMLGFANREARRALEALDKMDEDARLNGRAQPIEQVLIPLFIPAVEIASLLAREAASVGGDFTDVYIARSKNVPEQARDLLRHCLRQGRTVLIVDGLDEAAAYRLYMETTLDGLARRGTQQLVVSTRELSFEDSCNQGRLQSFKRMVVQPLTDALVRKVVQARIGDLKAQDTFLEQLKVVATSAAEFKENPYMLCLAIAVFKQRGEIPTRGRELYSLSVGNCCSRSVSRARESVGLEPTKVISMCEQFLGCLAYVCHVKKKQRDFTFDSGLRKTVQERWGTVCGFEESHFSHCESVLFGSPLVGVLTCIADGAGASGEAAKEYRFSHLTQQEYLAGVHVLQSLLPESAASQLYGILEPVCGGWVRQVLHFVAEMASLDTYVSFCECVLDAEDGTGSHCELVCELLSLREAEHVKAKLREKYAAIRKLDSLVCGFCHPSPDMRRLVASELRRFDRLRCTDVRERLFDFLNDAHDVPWFERCAAICSLAVLGLEGGSTEREESEVPVARVATVIAELACSESLIQSHISALALGNLLSAFEPGTQRRLQVEAAVGRVLERRLETADLDRAAALLVDLPVADRQLATTFFRACNAAKTTETGPLLDSSYLEAGRFQGQTFENNPRLRYLQLLLQHAGVRKMLMEDVSSCLSVLRSCWESIGALATILQQDKGGKDKAEADVKTILEASIKVLDVLGQSAGVTAVGGAKGLQHSQDMARALSEDKTVLKSALASNSGRSPEGMPVSHSDTLVSALSTTAVTFIDALLRRHADPSPTAQADVRPEENRLTSLSKQIEEMTNKNSASVLKSARVSRAEKGVTQKGDQDVTRRTEEGTSGVGEPQSRDADSHGAKTPTDLGESDYLGVGSARRSEGHQSDEEEAPSPKEAQAEHCAEDHCQASWSTEQFMAWDSALHESRLGAQEHEIYKIWPSMLAGQGSAEDLVEQAEPSLKGPMKLLFTMTGSGDLSLWAKEMMQLLRAKALGRFMFSFVLRYVEACFDKNPLRLPVELEGLKGELQALRDQPSGDSPALALEADFLLKDLDFGRRAMELPAFAGKIEQPIPECDYFDGPAGTKIPTFRRFYCKLPAEKECKIPDLANAHSLHILQGSFAAMGFEHESEWRRLPHRFHSELQGIIEGMDPLDADLPDKLGQCLGEMKEGVSILAQMEPFVPLDYKAKIQELNEQLDEYRKQMLQCESDGEEDSEALREKLGESLQEFDGIFKELTQKYNEALGRTEALKNVEEDGKKFETSLKQVKDLLSEAKDQLAAEKGMMDQALQTQDEADEFQADVEKRQGPIPEVARANRLSYMHFCKQQVAISDAIRTRIRRAENQVRVLEASLGSLERLQAQYAQSLKTAREVSEEQRLDAGIDSFEAYCGTRKFHHIDYCNKGDALEMESDELKKLEKDKKKLEVTARRLRTDRAKEELKRAIEKYEEQMTQYKICETEVKALETTKAEHLELIEPIFKGMKQPRAAAVGASARLDELHQKALTLEYPTKWEQDYENEANQFQSQIEEEVAERWIQCQASHRRRGVKQP